MMAQITDNYVPLELYTETLDELVTSTKPVLEGLIIMSPYYIEPDQSEPVRAMMDQYGKAAKEIAEKHQVIFVDIQAAFDDALRHTHSSDLSWDRVHPNHGGHMIIARAFLKAIGYKWD